MTPYLATLVTLGYFGLLFLISLTTSRNTSSHTFFTAERKSHWFLVSFGMLGVAISGITFISVPGEVGNTQFTYFQLVIGYAIGLILIALLFLPLFYRLKLVSIYTYLEQRYGLRSYKTGAVIFLVSQTMMASFRLYLMASVLQIALFDHMGVPFAITVLITLLMIWLYTVRSGIKTVVITDVLQTTFLVASVLLSIWMIGQHLGLNAFELIATVKNHPDSHMFDWDWSSTRNFFKLVLTGIFLTVVNNGIDHSVMQKHLTCPSLKESQKNMFVLSGLVLGINLLFLALGLLLHLYAGEHGIAIPVKSDELFPLLALRHFNAVAGVMFLLGISAAAYSSADSALTGLTTSFCVDVLNFEKKERTSVRVRSVVHLGFSGLVWLVVMALDRLNSDSVVNAFIRVSGYTYGPLLALFLFGMFTRIKVRDRYVPWLCLAVPAFSLLLQANSQRWLWGYTFGFEMLIVITLLTMLGLFLLRERARSEHR